MDTVKHVYKTAISEIRLTQNSCVNPDPYHESKAVNISEPGLYQLIFLSRLDTANEFCSRLFEEVLPTIYKEISYTIDAMKLSLRKLRQRLSRPLH